MNAKTDTHPDKKLVAVCGLFCSACTLHIGTTENDPKRLKAVADAYHIPPESWECHGCRSEKRAYFCRNLYKKDVARGDTTYGSEGGFKR